VVAIVRDRLAVNKRKTQKSDTERFNLKKLNEAERKEQYLKDEFCLLGYKAM
jgi:hypothetical protein